ncbi:hypothetical protein GWK47_011304 [Chionoecetes opilio]|uniref:Uncharacterized protein n=1 Tax=Chionoecetes opilio TaxID=41210 RepID=A0A8J4XWM6_CHIOP|nr:hypothetical protein GWK47_011304 [Chionoecetes opilio]
MMLSQALYLTCLPQEGTGEADDSVLPGGVDASRRQQGGQITGGGVQVSKPWLRRCRKQKEIDLGPDALLRPPHFRPLQPRFCQSNPEAGRDPRKELGVIFPCEGGWRCVSPYRQRVDGRSFPSQCRTNLSVSLGFAVPRSCSAGLLSHAIVLEDRALRDRHTPMSIPELERS